MMPSVADLCDKFSDKLQIANGILRPYGAVRSLCGAMETVQIDEDNRPVIAALEKAGEGRVLVVDAAGARHCAIVGDRLAGLALKNGWAGLIVNGCVRDTEALHKLPLGVWALGTCPIRSAKRAEGKAGIAVSFAGITFRAGEFLYADADGIVTSSETLVEASGVGGLIEPVFAENAPKPNGHYAQAVRHGGLVFMSMQLPIDPFNPAAPIGPIKQQAEQVIQNMKNILEAAGSGLDRALRVTIYVTDIALWGDMNAVFTQHFGAHKPARGVVVLPAIHMGYQIAIDAIAAG